MTAHRDQYERMLRWYRRFEALNKGRDHVSPSDNYIDDVYGFFLNAYHLKDWIKNDLTIPADVRNSVEAYINTNRELKLAADISNALKHLTLDSSRSKENPRFRAKQYGLQLGGNVPTINLKYEIEVESGLLDAFTLATGCIQAWNHFFSTHNL